MTLAKMIDGNLWILASDAVKMAENAYKNGQADEREAIKNICKTEQTEDSADLWNVCSTHLINKINKRNV
jgi:hypothetical protein